jgi:hypothetical protein
LSERYSKEQLWGALRKAWKGYKIAKAENDVEKMKEYAQKVRALQKSLNLPQSNFKVLEEGP